MEPEESRAQRGLADKYEFAEKPKSQPVLKRTKRRGDEDDEEEERPSRRTPDGGDPGAKWQKGRVGLLLIFVAACIFAGSVGVEDLLALVARVFTLSLNAVETIVNISKVLHFLVFGQAIVAVVGYVFCVMVPNKHGALGLAIAALSLGGINLITRLQFELLPLLGKGGGFSIGSLRDSSLESELLAITLRQLLFDAELIVAALFVRAVAVSFRDYQSAQNAIVVVILGGVHAGIRLISSATAFIVIGSAGRRPMSRPGQGYHYFMEAFYWGAVVVFLVELAFYALTVFSTRDAIDEVSGSRLARTNSRKRSIQIKKNPKK